MNIQVFGARGDCVLSAYGTPRPCRGCQHWGGDIPGTGNADCQRDGSQSSTSANQGVSSGSEL